MENIILDFIRFVIESPVLTHEMAKDRNGHIYLIGCFLWDEQQETTRRVMCMDARIYPQEMPLGCAGE